MSRLKHRREDSKHSAKGRIPAPAVEPEAAASPASFATATLELQPDPAQLQLLESNPHRLLLNCSRQWGKSTITAAKAAHQAHTARGHHEQATHHASEAAKAHTEEHGHK